MLQIRRMAGTVTGNHVAQDKTVRGQWQGQRKDRTFKVAELRELRISWDTGRGGGPAHP